MASDSKASDYKTKILKDSRVDLVTTKYDSIYFINKEVTNTTTGDVKMKPVVIVEHLENKWVDGYGYQNLVKTFSFDRSLFESAVEAYENL